MKSYNPKKYDVYIAGLLATYRTRFLAHPFMRAAKQAFLPLPILQTFAFHQYSDSILWVPMLSLMKSRIRSPRLLRAVSENIEHETGLKGASHIDLARQMMRSLNLTDLKPFPSETFAEAAQFWISKEFTAANFGEAEIAGWLMVAETLVPMMFEAVLPSFERLVGCQTRYFSEHVSVDGDEHSKWMRESVQEILENGDATVAERIIAGMKDAYEEAIEIPNQLWEAAK